MPVGKRWVSWPATGRPTPPIRPIGTSSTVLPSDPETDDGDTTDRSDGHAAPRADLRARGISRFVRAAREIGRSAAAVRLSRDGADGLESFGLAARAARAVRPALSRRHGLPRRRHADSARHQARPPARQLLRGDVRNARTRTAARQRRPVRLREGALTKALRVI